MDEESSSVSTAESTLECPTGTDTELLRIKGAELSLMGHDQSIIAIRSGEFTTRVIRQSISPLSTAICTVGDHQWPMAKDSPVLRVGPKKFSFTLPGFFYGLTLPDSCLEDDMKRLEELLMRFCAYEDHSDPNLCMPGAETEFWRSALPGIENLSNQMLEKITAGQVKSTVWDENSNSMSNKVQKAIRMSAVVKLVSKALLKGAIDLNLHVNVVGRTSTSANRKHGRTCAFASIRVYSDLVDAVETAGRSITSNASHRITRTSGRYWNFNKSGLTLLLRAVAATAVVHVVKNSIAAVGAKAGEAGSEFTRPVTELTSNSCLTGSNSVEKPVEACGL